MKQEKIDKAVLPEFDSNAAVLGDQVCLATNEELMQEVDVKLEAYLGEAEIPVSTLTKLKDGELVTLSTKPGDAVTLKLNGKVVALGELVVVDDHLGIKITQTAG
ncbi:MAG: FliM/FliN family flagellar motor C-terminal domain-containing protein [Pseudomonadota bacterium]